MKSTRLCLVIFALLSTASLASAQFRRGFVMPGGVAGPGQINLPYITADAQGNQWMVYGQGTVQMQGNSPVFSQAGQLTVNNMQPMAAGNFGRIDDKTHELILENMTAGSVTVTRRILIKPESQTVRFIDIFSNPTAAVQTINLRWTTNLNFGVQSATFVADPKRKGQNLAWVAQTGNNQTALEWVAAPGAKLAPTLAWSMNQPFVQSTLAAPIPANGKIAIVRIDGVVDSTAAAQKWVDDVKPRTLLADLPNDVRQIIVNVPARAAGLSTDIDLLRGDLLDVVELRGGDRIVGTLGTSAFAVHSAFGSVDIAADRLLGVLNTGPQPLWVMTDGQVLAGPADAATFPLATAGGGTLAVPWPQVSRIGFRRRRSEPAEANDGVPPLAAPAIVLATGDRLKLTPPTDAIDVLTRYGPMHLSEDSIGSISFTDPDAPVDVIALTDGSRFTGLISARSFAAVAPLLNAGAKATSFDVGRISQLQLHDAAEDSVAADAPSLVTSTGNTFTGTLQRAVTVRSVAGPVTLDAGVISSIAMSDDDTTHNLKFTTTDGTAITGRAADDDWSLRTTTGLDLTIPVQELKSYANPAAAPSAMSRSGLDPWIAQLNADDWKQRDSAEHQLLKLGPAVSSTLRQAREKQTPEAQQRIDSILKQLDAMSRTQSR